MLKKVQFSGEIPTLTEIAAYHSDINLSLRSFFSPAPLPDGIRFAGYSRSEILAELSDRASETDIRSTLVTLTALEGVFRTDYLQRVYRKKRDGVSRAFREIHKTKGARASLDEDIFETWKVNTTGGAVILSEIRGAFKIRDWIAHGRYWVPKLGRAYEFDDVYQLAVTAISAFPLLES